jgi:hypothetical protein
LDFWFENIPSGNPASDPFQTGLPDGLFASQKSQVGKNFQGLRLKNVNIFYGHLEYFMDIWDIV